MQFHKKYVPLIEKFKIRGVLTGIYRLYYKVNFYVVRFLNKTKLGNYLLLVDSVSIRSMDVPKYHDGDQFQLIFQKQNRLRKLPIIHPEENKWYFEDGKSSTVDESYLVFLKNGFAMGYHGGRYLNANRKLIGDLGTEHWIHYGQPRAKTTIYWPKPKNVKGIAAIISHPHAKSNFSHWLFDILPQFILLEKHIPLSEIDEFYVISKDKSFHEETFTLFSIPKSKIHVFSGKMHLTAECLIIPSLSRTNNQNHHRQIIHDIKKRLLGDYIPRPGRKLFVSRDDASFRRLIGEESLFAELKLLGFEKVILSGKGLRETAKLFSEAEVVVGPFGSVLMNAVFCPKGALLIDITNPNFYNSHHWAVADEAGLDYAVYFGNAKKIPKNCPPNRVFEDIEIDPTQALIFIKKVLFNKWKLT